METEGEKGNQAGKLTGRREQDQDKGEHSWPCHSGPKPRTLRLCEESQLDEIHDKFPAGEFRKPLSLYQDLTGFFKYMRSSLEDQGVLGICTSTSY